MFRETEKVKVLAVRIGLSKVRETSSKVNLDQEQPEPIDSQDKPTTGLSGADVDLSQLKEWKLRGSGPEDLSLSVPAGFRTKT